MRRWAPMKRLHRWVIDFCTHLLTRPLDTYVQRVPNDIKEIKKVLRKGDILLVEGDQRISQVIRYLTQSSWSHCCLYVGDELMRGDTHRAQALSERFGDDARFLLIEAVECQGVIAAPLAKYEKYNIRICRPEGLRREDVEKVLADVIAHLGDSYDVRHIFDLARFFFPVSIVPRRWRRTALQLSSGSEQAVICSSMIASAFGQVGYPILPKVTVEEAGNPLPWWRRLISRNHRRRVARFRRHDPALITPRDFDLSPYFKIIKFNHLADRSFNYRDIVWEEIAAAPGATENTGM